MVGEGEGVQWGFGGVGWGGVRGEVRWGVGFDGGLWLGGGVVGDDYDSREGER